MWTCKNCGSEAFLIDKAYRVNKKKKNTNVSIPIRERYICVCCGKKSYELEDIAEWCDDDMWLEK